MASAKHIAYYVSAHGYGHGVRSCDIIRALIRLYPDVAITLVSDLPAAFLRNRIGSGRVTIRAGAFDVGMVQLDSIRVDVPATLARVQALYAQEERLVSAQAHFLREIGARVVVADVPAIPIEAAKKLGRPAVAVGNFAWDWIYGEFAEADARWTPLVKRFEQSYAKADLLLRLPFAEPMSAFPKKLDVPLLATPGKDRRRELAAMMGADPAKTWVLLSFTSLEWNEEALARVEKLSSYEFFTVRPLNWRRHNIHPVDREKIPFSDVLASADIVVSKPGFGLMSECVVNRKPLVYADRSDFREYAVLVESIRRFLRNQHIPSAQLYAGELGEALDQIAKQPEAPERLGAGGDEIAARRIAEFL